jgi:hypothetical protein
MAVLVAAAILIGLAVAAYQAVTGKAAWVIGGFLLGRRSKR